MANTDLTKLSAKKLHALIAERSAEDTRTCDACIRAGMGHMTGNEIAELAKGSSLMSKVLIARERTAARAAYSEALNELDARQRYQGNDKPIKREA